MVGWKEKWWDGRGDGGMEGKWWDGRENDVMEGGMVGRKGERWDEV